MRVALTALAISGVGSIGAGCGPACVDDRCSLTPAAPQVTRVDYTNIGTGSGAVTATGTGSGSAAPKATGSGPAPVATGSGSGAPTVVASGSGAGSGSGSGSAPIGAGSGSAKPPDPPVSAAWGPLGDSFKMYVTSKGVMPQNANVRIEFVKTPTKTPFVVTLETKPADATKQSEAVWNDCPEGKIVCDPGGTKSHSTKRAGNVLIQVGVNWAVTTVTDDTKGTLVTWTNNLSRETLQLRLLK